MHSALGRCKQKWEDNIKISLKEIGYEGVWRCGLDSIGCHKILTIDIELPKDHHWRIKLFSIPNKNRNAEAQNVDKQKNEEYCLLGYNAM
jgi:hypothetical protein